MCNRKGYLLGFYMRDGMVLLPDTFTPVYTYIFTIEQNFTCIGFGFKCLVGCIRDHHMDREGIYDQKKEQSQLD
jgi:hypothetical protein